MKNAQLRVRTKRDIDAQVAKVLRGLGNPEPPLNLLVVRELLRLDLGYYSSTDDSLVCDTLSRLRVAGVQILKRPTILGEAIRTASLKALYLPDQKRILIDSDLPTKKQRWSEAHEVCHDIIPWHAESALGDAEQTLTPTCHAQIEGVSEFLCTRSGLNLDRRKPHAEQRTS